jgi:UDP-N-acetylglucosamine diphosphorylase/glucosamine-1-phosphate N-acetyltransferase
VSDLFLYDDAIARTFEPFALTRPVSELRAGTLLLRERWERALGLRAAGVVTSPHLAEFNEPWGVEATRGVLRAGSVLANSRCAVALSPAPGAGVWTCAKKVAALVLSRDVDVEELDDGRLSLEEVAQRGSSNGDGRRDGTMEIQGRWMDHVWDFIGTLAPMLTEDIEILAATATRAGAAIGMIGGSHGAFAEDGATIEPQVYFDTNAGPVLVRRGATVMAFTRIVGPCVIGAESLAGGDRIAGSSIGELCKVHGELNASIFLGHANKAHDGYVGHSYLGRWVNLGAGTITSNLKNTYSTVELWTPEGERDTGLQFLGTFFGDHTKTGIGTLLNTGTVIGAGANLYGGDMPPKVVPPFAWGARSPYSTYRMDKFLEVAGRMMARRHVELSARQSKQLSIAYERASKAR